MTQRVPETMERFFWELPLSRATITPSPDLPPYTAFLILRARRDSNVFLLSSLAVCTRT